MNDQVSTLRIRLRALRANPRIAAIALMSPGQQVFDLVDQLVAELELLDRRTVVIEQAVRELDKRVAAPDRLPRAALTTEHPLRSR